MNSQSFSEKMRRFLQFDLRQLLVLFAVLSLLFGAIAPWIWEAFGNRGDPNVSRLIRAVQEGDVELARRALEAGAFPNEISGDLDLVDTAIENGQVEMMDVLLEHGAYPLGIVDAIEGEHPIEVRLEMIRCLVRHGADLSRDYVGGAGMNAALRIRDEEVCDLLRELGVEYGPREMAALNRLEELQHATEERPSIIPERVAPFETHWRGEDPSLLGIALSHGYREMAVFLIDQGAPLDTTEGEGATLLHRATRGGDPRLIRLLAARGLDVNARDDHGETPLLKNVLCSTFEAIDTLIEMGVDLDACGINEETALHRAATHNRTEVVQKLLVAGADLAITDGNGRTVLEAVREQLEWRLEERDDASYGVQWREECEEAVRNYREIEGLLLEAER